MSVALVSARGSPCPSPRPPLPRRGRPGGGLRRSCWWLVLLCASTGAAQNLVLDSFNAGAATGSVRAGTTWVGHVTQNSGSITVGGTARDDNGWGVTGRSINATGMTFITITAQRDADHAAPNFALQFEDRNLQTQVFTVSSLAFAAGVPTQVQIAMGNWAAGFDPAQITSWSIGGGALGAAAFRMTIDHLALTATASPGVPVAPAVAGSFGALTRAPGEDVTFTVTATGTAPLAYQWFKNGTTPVTGNASATTPSLTLSGLTALENGSYTCTVTNAAGSVVSGAFTLSVSALPATVTLANLSTVYTGTARTVTATTSPAGLPVVLTYNGSPTAPVNAGSYLVAASVSSPTHTGRAEGTLVVARATQSITFAPLPTTIRVGETFPLTATASSGGPVVLTVLRGTLTLIGANATVADATPVTVRATQVGGANHLPVSTDLSFTISKQNQSIDFAGPTGPLTGTAPLALTATATSRLPVTFSVVSGPAAITGANLTVTNSGVVVVRASQPGSDTYNAAPDVDRTVTVALPAPPVPPVILAPPVGRNVPPGSILVLSVSAAGDGPLAYQWFKDGAAIPGATAAAWTIASVAAGDAGSYRVDVTSPFGSTRSPAAAIVVTTQSEAPAPRLVNFSTRARAGTEDQVAIAGFVIAGDRPKPVLIRAVGPGLTAFGVDGALGAPKLELFRGSSSVASNSGWSTGGAATELAAAASRAGAFALATGSADAALLATLSPGNYTAVISAADGRPGVGLVEVYDLSAADAGRGVSNLSVRVFAGAEADILILGVVVQGTAPKRLLLRAVGPGLVRFGVADVLARPQLTILSGTREIARNAGWSDSPEADAIRLNSAQAGAFALEAGSLDAALIVSLPPGAYTAQVSGVAGTTGIALLEAYELP